MVNTRAEREDHFQIGQFGERRRALFPHGGVFDRRVRQSFRVHINDAGRRGLHKFRPPCVSVPALHGDENIAAHSLTAPIAAVSMLNAAAIKAFV